MEFSEVNELNNIIEYSQTFYQDGLTVMKQQLLNTPKSSFIGAQEQQDQKNHHNYNMQGKNYQQPVHTSLAQQKNDQQLKRSELLEKDTSNKEETIDDIISQIENIQNNECNEQLNKSNKKDPSNEQEQDSNQKNTSEKKQEKQDDVKNEITQIINTYKKNIIPSDDSSDSDSSDDESQKEKKLQPVQEELEESENKGVDQENRNTQNQEQGQENYNQQKNQQQQQDIIEYPEEIQQEPKSVFEKLDVSQSFASKKKSLFTQNINSKGGTTQNQSIAKIQSINNPNMRKIEVFFFSSPEYRLTVAVLKSITVLELIQQIIEAYLNDEKCDNEKMRYPNDPKAYELRILEDDDCCVPDMSFPPLMNDRNIKSIQIDQIAFIENYNYKPPLVTQKEQIEIHPNFSKIESTKNKNNLLLKISIPDSQDCFTTVIPIAIDKHLRDIFVPLQKKNPKISSKSYIIKAKDKNGQSEELDPCIPISYLQTNVIELQRRNFADMPIEEEQIYQSFVQGLIQEDYQKEQYGKKVSHENYNAPLNSIQASKYEEFEVVKINDKGKRQERILGINQYKIFNINSKLPSQNLGLLNQLFSNKLTGTKKAERLIEDILSIDITEPCCFSMKVKNDQTHGIKVLKYETKTPALARNIVEKIKFLIKNQQ